MAIFRRGNRRGRFGAYEARQTFSWRGFAYSVTGAVLTVALAQLVPHLEESAGWPATLGAALGITLRAVQEWLRDNTGKSV